MSRLAVVGLLALACGSESAAWDELNRAGEGGDTGAQGGTQATAGSVSESGSPPVVTGGSASEAGQGGGAEAKAGGPAIGGDSATGGQTQGGGAGGSDSGGAAVGGKATAGAASGGQSGAGGSVSGGSAGAAQAVCASDDWMDCNGLPNDGGNKIVLDSCETGKTDHDNCGACGHKCGLTQTCKRFGAPGAWTFECGSL